MQNRRLKVLLIFLTVKNLLLNRSVYNNWWTLDEKRLDKNRLIDFKKTNTLPSSFPPDNFSNWKDYRKTDLVQENMKRCVFSSLVVLLVFPPLARVNFTLLAWFTTWLKSKLFVSIVWWRTSNEEIQETPDCVYSQPAEGRIALTSA